MEIVHTKTQEEYDRLMEHLEEKYIQWRGGGKSTNENIWSSYGKETIIFIQNSIFYGSICGATKSEDYPNIKIQAIVLAACIRLSGSINQSFLNQ